MACFYPLTAYRSSDGAIFFASKHSGRGDTLLLPCGQCVGCRLERSRAWATRCVHEAQMHHSNCFITLTYDDDHIPDDWSLDYSHFQKFVKRLRKAVNVPVRYYMAGEYGESYGRPHFHACLFGYDFPDRVVHARVGSGFFIYRSAILENLWPFGFSSVADFSFETAAYVARYIMKKVTGQAADMHYLVVDKDTGELYNRTPEFCRMSLKPGIGATWFDKYGLTDVVVRDRVIVRGKSCPVPRYYDKILEKVDPLRLDDNKQKRELDRLANRCDNTDARLEAKRRFTEARISFLKRTLR